MMILLISSILSKHTYFHQLQYQVFQNHKPFFSAIFISF